MFRRHVMKALLVLPALVILGGIASPPAQAQQGRSADAGKALVRRYYEEVYDKGNLAVVDEVVAANFAGRNYPGQPPGNRDELKQFAAGLRAAFPDIRFMIDDQIAEGDKVVTRWTMRGTHKGPLRSVPATGKPVTMTGIVIHRIVGGKIVEGWANTDELGMLRQLGALPAAEPARR